MIVGGRAVGWVRCTSLPHITAAKVRRTNSAIPAVVVAANASSAAGQVGGHSCNTPQAGCRASGLADHTLSWCAPPWRRHWQQQAPEAACAAAAVPSWWRLQLEAPLLRRPAYQLLLEACYLMLAAGCAGGGIIAAEDGGQHVICKHLECMMLPGMQQQACAARCAYCTHRLAWRWLCNTACWLHAST